MNRLYLGIDTSNYTSSIAVVDQTGTILADSRRVLKVKTGEKGLRQQEALFQHLQNLPELFDSLDIDMRHIAAVGISSRPRPEKGSYMPVFLAGESFGKVISKALGVPLRWFSHQEGHAACGLMNYIEKDRFLCLHISGGTTELLKIQNQPENLITRIAGGTLDISLGQLVDRIGVSLGYGFPCGAEMDIASQSGQRLQISMPIKIKDGWINLSGYENKFAKLVEDKSLKHSDVCRTLFHVVAEVIEALIIDRSSEEEPDKIIIVGGVAENTIAREHLTSKFGENRIVFTKPGLSSDNAVGIAWLAGNKQGWEE